MQNPDTNAEHGAGIKSLFVQAETAVDEMNAMIAEANITAQRMIEELDQKNDALLADLDAKHARLLAMVEVFNRWTDDTSEREDQTLTGS